MYFGVVLLARGICCAPSELRHFIHLPLPICVLPTLLSLTSITCCAQCPEGTRRNPSIEFMTSAYDCIVCAAGFACSVGSVNATACSPGTYNPDTRQSRCAKCDRGTYQDRSGATRCKECRRGHYCVEGSSTPVREARSNRHYNLVFRVIE